MHRTYVSKSELSGKLWTSGDDDVSAGSVWVKCTVLVSDIDHERGSACAGLGEVCAVSVPASQFCCKPTASLKTVF